jgi:hypothetical protein
MYLGAYRAVKIHSVVFWVMVSRYPSSGGYAALKMEMAYSCKS